MWRPSRLVEIDQREHEHDYINKPRMKNSTELVPEESDSKYSDASQDEHNLFRESFRIANISSCEVRFPIGMHWNLINAFLWEKSQKPKKKSEKVTRYSRPSPAPHSALVAPE